MSDERRWAERKVGLARLWARAKQVLTTDPRGSQEDDLVVDEEAARVLAAQAGRLKGGLAKVAQLAAYDPRTSVGRATLGPLWDRMPAVAASEISRVVEQELGKPPQLMFAEWSAAPIAAASLGQVHSAKLHDGREVVVKVQYPSIADALRADLDDPGFVRRLAGAEIGRALEPGAIEALAQAVRRELDYRAEAAAQEKFAAAWEGDPVLRIPRVIADCTTTRVLTMERARGKTIVATASASPDVRRAAALGVYKMTWGSPLAHGLLNADPNPGNFLVETAADGHVHVWCLDFGCALEIEPDREIWWGLLDDDTSTGAERFRMALAKSGLLRRTDSLATTAHREWERALAMPLETHGDFHWSAAYASELAETTSRVLASGGLALPASLVLLWRQRLGAASVIGMLDAHAPFRRVLLDLIGTGKKALR